MKMAISIKLLRDDNSDQALVDEWHSTIELTQMTPEDNTNGVVAALRVACRRVLINRGLLVPDEEDKGKRKR